MALDYSRDTDLMRKSKQKSKEEDELCKKMNKVQCRSNK